MFTGIVEAVGTVKNIEDRPGFRKLWIDGPRWLDELPEGASLAINGCCTTGLTTGDGFACDLMRVTLEKTSLGELRLGGRVNLERPLNFGAPLGGHLVQGHVDETGEVIAVAQDGDNRRVEIGICDRLRRYVVLTGSIAIDGVSMTVAEIKELSFVVGVIPHTWEVTVFQEYAPGRKVNLEVDMIGKYIEQMLPKKFVDEAALQSKAHE
ncbi:MAG: riboflavin synthase [bacterium]|nr:riboflavin synthase [bacterium]